MRVGFLQFRPALADIEKNLDQIEALLPVGQNHADLIVLPELALSGYLLGSSARARALAVGSDSEALGRLGKLSAALDSHLVVGFAESAGERVYNSAALIGASGVEEIWRKAHLFGDEPDWFAPGDKGFFCADVRGVCIGVMICFDWAFPESAGTLARAGAQIIAHPSNLVLPHAFKVMPTRALENRVFTVTANRWGEERCSATSLLFRGGSLIVGPDGQVIEEGPVHRDALRIVDLDPHLADDKRMTPRNHLWDDRRPDLYS